MTALQVFTVFVLIGINAFFSAAEFSLVAVRVSRLRELVKKGNARARLVEELVSDLGRTVSGVQVGITATSLALGYIGELTFADVVRRFGVMVPWPWGVVAIHGVALVLAFGLLTVLQAILGELVPKALSLARAERVALIIARPFWLFLKAFRPVIDLLDGAAARIVRALGVASPHSHTLVRSAEELRMVIQQANEKGLLPPAEMRFVENVIGLGRIQVREVMVPRPDIHALPAGASFEDTMKLFATTQRSRLPVHEGTLDHIIGFVHIKDLTWVLMERARRAEEDLPPLPFDLRRIIRDVYIVPETKPAGELLLEFRSRRAGLAMVVDEFGSILGMVTLEDILEQMVGEIHDEFDVVERPLRLGDGSFVFDASLKVRDLAAQYNVVLPDDPGYETLGGFVLARLGFLPRGGETFESDGFRFTVTEVERRRISRVKIKPREPFVITAPAHEKEGLPGPRQGEPGRGDGSKGAEKTPAKAQAAARRASKQAGGK